MPGDNLFDFAAYFVFRREAGSGGRATSQWEALERSQCKKKAGDRMTCTTCHDPHDSPNAREKVTYFRNKCLQCHSGTNFAKKHHPENPDCVECHMAQPPSSDIAHEQVTDHRIRKRVNNQPESEATDGELAEVTESGLEPGGDKGDLGLAYAQLAAGGNKEAAERALELLKEAEHAEAGARKDSDLHEELGFLEEMNGEDGTAGAEYRTALESDPFDSVAAGDLALLNAGQRHYREAIRLWNTAFGYDPTQVGAGMNLAIIECEMGERGAAEKSLDRVLEFEPDYGKARDVLAAVESGQHECGSR